MDRVTARPAAATAWKPKLGPALRSLPPRRPLAMPIQSLEKDEMGQACVPFLDSRAWRRTAVVGATLVSTLGASAVMARLLEPMGFSVADGAMLTLFVLLFAWVAFAFVSAIAGFVLMWRARDLEPWRPQPIIFSRTALLMPTYNEDPGRILSGVQAIYEELAGMGVSELYDIFVLSDTRDGAIAQAEATGVLRLRLKLEAPDRIFYRRRAVNLDRKAGNVADWVANFGAGYESMIVLDADSLMTGDTIVRLTAAMERDRKVGLIQTLPSIIGASTLFARLQQFAARVYGPVIAQGQAWWSGAEGNYWGHNAIIRTRAFAACAGLPHIKSGKPFGGHIMSHDFVEAALLRRGGWAVRMAPDLTGSYEEAPPSLIDMAVRDRRWCQGNLQHSAVLGAKGLHWVSRLHLARGVLAYLTAPLWLAFLVLGGVVWFQQRGAGHALEASMAGALFAATMALLLIPKLLGAVLVARDRAAREACGGVLGLALSVVGEVALSALMAPIFMLMHSRAVVDVLRGRHSGWAAQQRDEGRLKFKRAWSRHWLHTLLGLGWGGAALALDPVLLAWTSPVTVGLVLAIPLSMATARADAGAASRRLGLFMTPEETAGPDVAARAAGLRAQYDAEAQVRFEIDRLFRAPAHVYRPEVQGVPAYLQAA
ncbi:glucans biosynthesis glucosyltransferase MdoH [Phenylobacterium sp.]|uniref:glucans biosynthesis glucosyltransferase MdoH n=1 Tax=Phenylobacterium sp. TaxID=1871053 RepID=UPI002730C723|nr:glucans biosynthesis glucosyltransferase MdoH [Phenylobacterium sp.]MDP1600944.1 glucans biosynthesis glucosyltransferase MdoH [Phenylobacterium sp.]MDP3594770.1 glucans biosynthesis glucosyltransferase MdoH [Phenylobacterium sp.]